MFKDIMIVKTFGDFVLFFLPFNISAHYSLFVVTYLHIDLSVYGDLYHLYQGHSEGLIRIILLLLVNVPSSFKSSFLNQFFSFSGWRPR